MSKNLVLRLFVVASSLAIIAHEPAFAGSGTVVPGTLRDTSAADAGQWMVKYLGGPNEVDPDTGDFVVNETFAWEKERSYMNGVLDTTGYAQAYALDGALVGSLPWVSAIPWISVKQDAFGEAGYFSYVATIDDTGFTSVGPMASFNGLSISFTADDHIHAVVINGVLYDGFKAQGNDHPSWQIGYVDLSILPGDGIPWNVSGVNAVEIVVHNSGYYQNIQNVTGLSASVQASYNISAVPEPSVVLMFSTGLLILPLARRLRKT